MQSEGAASGALGPDGARPADAHPSDADPDGARPADPDPPAPWGAAPVAQRLGLTPPSEVGRAALNRAKAAARAKGLRPGSPGSPGRSGAPRPEQRSGPGRDGRDPVTVGETLERLAVERGWSTELSVGGVIGRWRDVVGDQVADHCTPESFDEGLLAVRTDSTAWATNLTLLVPELLARLAVELGPEVVTEVRVLGPAAPRWSRGRRSVPGRGPRDTYG